MAGKLLFLKKTRWIRDFRHCSAFFLETCFYHPDNRLNTFTGYLAYHPIRLTHFSEKAYIFLNRFVFVLVNFNESFIEIKYMPSVISNIVIAKSRI